MMTRHFSKRTDLVVYPRADCVDARDLDLTLPPNVERCYWCEGNGQLMQRYMEGPGQFACDCCRGTGFIYSATAKGVPISVTNQIAVASGAEIRNLKGHHTYGLDWVRKQDG